jgi:hypothetical protein
MAIVSCQAVPCAHFTPESHNDISNQELKALSTVSSLLTSDKERHASCDRPQRWVEHLRHPIPQRFPRAPPCIWCYLP